jgi:hypothetical protein
MRVREECLCKAVRGKALRLDDASRQVNVRRLGKAKQGYAGLIVKASRARAHRQGRPGFLGKARKCREGHLIKAIQGRAPKQGNSGHDA